MKARTYFRIMLMLLALTTTSCSDDDDNRDENYIVTNPVQSAGTVRVIIFPRKMVKLLKNNDYE